MPLPIPASRDAIDKIHSERKPMALERARQAPFHKERLKGIDPARLDDPAEWAKIPLLDKDELRAIPPEDFHTEFCVGKREDIAEFWRSGGSTGVPLFYPRSFEDMKYMDLSFSRSLLAAGLGAGEVAHVAFPLGIHPIGQVFARVAQAAGMAVAWAGAGGSTPSAMQVAVIDMLKPTVLLTMSSYAIHLANIAEQQGIDLAGGSVKMVLCSAEPLSDSKRVKIGRMWGAEVRDNFGMTEVSMMGAESEARDGFHMWADMFVIEVVDLDTGQPVPEGEEGGLVVTPLFTNTWTPFIRWSSGDIVRYKSHGATDGPLSVFPVVQHAGRTVGFFKVAGVNINHEELEDFMFARADIVDFKAELVTKEALEVLRISLEIGQGQKAGQVEDSVALDIRNTFQVTPDIVVLERGTLAREFESSVKAPRFVDRRE